MIFKEVFEQHRYKFILSAPVIFLLLINTVGVAGSGNIFFFTPEKTIFAVTGENVHIALNIDTKLPINAVGGTVVFPPEFLAIDTFSRDTSIIDLWAEEPTFSNENGTLHLSGGIVPKETKDGDHGTVLVASFRALKAGKAAISMKDGQLLAANGEGTNIITGSNVLTLYIHDQGKISPDMNGDGVLSISDVNTLYLKTFRAYNPRYDLNGDGKVSWADVKMLIELM
jgi:hypothetical protein